MFGKKSASESEKGRFWGKVNDPTVSVDTKAGIDRALKFAKSDPVPIETEAKKTVREALRLLEMAAMGIDAINENLREARTYAEMAKMVEPQERTKLEQKFDEHCDRIDDIVANSSTDGQCLLDGGNHNLQVPLTGKANSLFVIRIVNATKSGLSLPVAEGKFETEEGVLEILTQVDQALERVEHIAAMYCANAAALADHYDKL